MPEPLMEGLGELFKVFQGLGVDGAVIMALLIVIYLMYRLIIHLLKALATKDASDRTTTEALVEVVRNSTASHMSVAVALSRIESALNLPSIPTETGP